MSPSLALSFSRLGAPFPSPKHSQASHSGTAEARHVPESANGIARRFELEEERGTRRAVKGVVVRRTPKVDLLATRRLREEIEPIAVRDRYPAFYHSFFTISARKSIAPVRDPNRDSSEARRSIVGHPVR